ncbi:hypothetical protein [Faecalibacter sp. LW9]|nr:hypothetical protein [Faecalibacter sp. LW9]
MLDIIGDIHGYSDHLEKLLQKLGYKNTNGIIAILMKIDQYYS